ncbi:pentapeptide repeat-containing protein [Chamaesiphon sp. OTE_20_metabat_361]|uniref:pentapeptide repeat-containing protein n=1 Tax=Chamaesiphon sp. OTE_20_metabat_361 TaxID=2964689 RepID=UPI00286A72B8|nr:pentapeptide repeat-containing protein [Chamaesiphon sp. OTE_20_metabat_361]
MIDIQELIGRYAAGERDFSSVGVIRQLEVPRGTNLSGINLRGCNFSELDFTEVNLVGANFSEVTCQFTSFRNADLRDANMSAATFWEGTDLSNADLSFANLSQLTVEDAILNGANMTGVDLRQAYIKAASFQAANLVQANLCDAWISSSNLQDANLAGVDLSKMKQWSLNKVSGANFENVVTQSSPLKSDELGTVATNVNLLSQISEGDIEIMKKEYLYFGDRLGAIRFFREKTGLDLAPAKEAVDLIMSRMES